jgi:hypothetical protein
MPSRIDDTFQRGSMYQSADTPISGKGTVVELEDVAVVTAPPPLVWQSAFGPMLIEVRDAAAFVNGSRVTSIHEQRADGPPA